MYALGIVCTNERMHLHICEYTLVQIYVHMYVYKRVQN